MLSSAGSLLVLNFLNEKKCKNAKAQIKGSAGGHLYSSSYVAEKL